MIYLEQQNKLQNENKNIKYSKQTNMNQDHLVKQFKRKYQSQYSLLFIYVYNRFQTAGDMIKKSKSNNN